MTHLKHLWLLMDHDRKKGDVSPRNGLCKYSDDKVKKDLISINELISSVKDYAYNMETERISRKKQALSLIDKTHSRVVDLIVSALRLSNLDIVASYVFRGGNKSRMPASKSVRSDVLGLAISDSQFLGTFGGIGTAGLLASLLHQCFRLL